jgi:hypothetical protein
MRIQLPKDIYNDRMGSAYLINEQLFYVAVQKGILRCLPI